MLSENKIRTEGAISLCQFLKGNRNLIKIDLTGMILLNLSYILPNELLLSAIQYSLYSV